MAVMAKTVGTPQKPPTSANTKVTSGGKIKATIDGTTYRQIVADIEAKSTPQYSPPNERGISNAGSAFLEENKARPGVVCLPSGLQYRVLKSGAATAKSPLRSTECDVHYRGKLIPAEGGIEFDSSYKRGETIEFPLNRVIAGWTEGVQLMKEGSKFRFYIPSKLAYGPRGAGRDIGPNEALIFVVELIKVK
jgi:FKBP-type peptidyl-prolyl cis-trans isomerase